MVSQYVPQAKLRVPFHNLVSEAFTMQNLHAIAHVFFGHTAFQLVRDVVGRNDRDEPVAFRPGGTQKMPVSLVEPVKNAEDHYLTHRS